MLALPANWRLRIKFVEAVDEELIIAPRPPTPVPEITNCLFNATFVPKTSSVPPLLMVMLEPVPPSDEELITWSVPADSVIAP